MTLWFVLAVMTAAAIFAVLWPLRRRGGPVSAGNDVLVYRDQLEEIGRDRAAGRIGDAEAEAARVEVSRRLLAAADRAENELPVFSRWGRQAVVIAALVLLPAGAGSLYLALGSPSLPGQPLAARLEGNPPIDRLVAQIETYLEQNPNDGRGWEVLAPVYIRMGRFDGAIKARRRALEILGPDAARLGDLGEAMVLAAGGVVTAEAKSLFERATALDPEDVMAPYYLGLAAKQDGRRDEAEKTWRALLARAPQGAPWIPLVQSALAEIDEKTVPATDAASAEHGGGSVEAMVERLAERLKKDGSDPDAWARLVRSYKVLEQPDKAKIATDDARRALAGDPDKLQRFDKALIELEADAKAASIQAAGGNAPTPPVPGDKAHATLSGPTEKEMAAAETLAPDQRSDMIRGMVDRLATRLKSDGGDIDGWLRLVRAYAVLGDRDKARSAIADARRAIAGDADKLRQLDDLVKNLGLEG